jgi:uncharacterized protein
MRTAMRRLIIVVACAVGLGFTGLCWLASSRLICPPRRVLQDYHQEILASAREHGMQIRSFTVDTGSWKGTPCIICEPSAEPGIADKGHKLRAELEAENVILKPWGEIIGNLVLLHGHTGRKEDHLPVAERLCAAGFRCILVDLPGHGDHPVRFASFGFHEASLPAEALNAAARTFHFEPSPAGIFGISQGGAIALQAAAAEQENWIAVGELSSFSDLDGVIANQARRMFGPMQAVARFVVSHLVKWRAGYDPALVRPLDAAARLDSIPVLIGHGDTDVFVPPDHARRLLEAVPSHSKQFLSIDGAGHSTVLITPQPVYATMAKFFLRAVQDAPKTISLSPAGSQSQ